MSNKINWNSNDILRCYVPLMMFTSYDSMRMSSAMMVLNELEEYRHKVWCTTLLDHFASTCTILRRA